MLGSRPSRTALQQDHIRNFVIIAHIDHGKSTLADRLLERTGTLAQREMIGPGARRHGPRAREGHHDQGQGRAHALHAPPTARTYQLNLIDTPGHVDFTYEVSRALAACEGALLVVDAAQGIEAQTLANVYLALEHDLEIIPVINKIDLPSAEPEVVREEIERVIGLPGEDCILASAKAGHRRRRDPRSDRRSACRRPRGDRDAPLRALIFDSHYDAYKGVIAYCRVHRRRGSGRASACA